VSEVLSTEPTREHLGDLVCTAERLDYLDGVDPARYVDSLIRPVREIVDRGGKSWRSYAALVCMDAVGGDSRPYARWLAMPEMLHVGSLIVDDVEDHSLVRRGGPACHVVYGEPIALNAGTAAYFLAEYPIRTVEMPAEKKLRLYGLFFRAMRAGHAGQALDLSGLDAYVPVVLESGQTHELERRVLAIHRLKTAVPAGILARMGAIAGDGSPAQVEGLGRFFEALGLAFQIIDDVLNLRGFKGMLKTRGEDISQGKVTLPVVKAFGVLPAEKRAWIWERLRAKTEDPAIVGEVIGRLEECGALQACDAQAKDLVESAWAELQPLIEDSISKVMLRAFSFYVLDRQY
jgi:geranylgeranyl pyrophosphate synthase